MKLVCPKPMTWHRVWLRLGMLAERHGIGEPPPMPLILAGWVYSNDVEKEARWNATVSWAREHGFHAELSIPAEDFYAVAELYGGMISPAGGPLYLPWRFDPAPSPEPSLLAERLSALRDGWFTLQPSVVTAVTEPIRFTGKKARRLEVGIQDEAVVPPWGTWTSLSIGPSRRTFTQFRAGVNQLLNPHEVDHVGFVWVRNAGY